MVEGPLKTHTRWAVACVVACTQPSGGGGGHVNAPPVAHAVATPDSGQAPLLVNFSGATSTDSDGSIIDYLWSFGDSPTPTTASGATASFTYPTAGVFTVLLTATDNNNATATDSVIVTVTMAANVAPTAAISASATSGVAHLPVNFDSAGSTDSDGTIVSRSWTFGDGNTSTDAAPQNLYTVAGAYAEMVYVAKDLNFKGANQGMSAGATPGTRRAETSSRASATAHRRAPPAASSATTASMAWPSTPRVTPR